MRFQTMFWIINGDFSDDGPVVEIDEIGIADAVYLKQTSAVTVMQHCQLKGYKEKNFKGEKLVDIGPVCSERSNKTVLQGPANNAIRSVACFCEIEMVEECKRTEKVDAGNSGWIKCVTTGVVVTSIMAVLLT